MKALLVGDSDAADAIAARVRSLGDEAEAVARGVLHAAIAGADGAIVVAFADDVAAVAELRDPHLLSETPLFVVTSRVAPTAHAELRAAGADDVVAWPTEAPLFEHRYRALAERIRLRREVASATRAEAELRTSEERRSARPSIRSSARRTSRSSARRAAATSSATTSSR